MRVLVIGGTGFIGLPITRELIRRDHDVTVFHRGRTAVPPGAHEVVGDRKRLTESADNQRSSNRVPGGSGGSCEPGDPPGL